MRIILPLFAIIVLGTAILYLSVLLAQESDPSVAKALTEHRLVSRKSSTVLAPPARATTDLPRVISDYDEILLRPIFFPNRRYPKPAPIQPKVTEPTQPKVPPKPPQPPPTFVGALHGILIDGEVRRALLSSSERAPEWIDLGETFNGWTVVAIESDGARLQQKSNIVEVKLYFPSP